MIGKVHRLGLPQRRPTQKDEPEAADVVRLDVAVADMCSWPVGNPGDRNFHFCGEPSAPGKPYCAKHCAVAYIRTPATAARAPSPDAPAGASSARGERLPARRIAAAACRGG